MWPCGKCQGWPAGWPYSGPPSSGQAWLPLSSTQTAEAQAEGPEVPGGGVAGGVGAGK